MHTIISEIPSRHDWLKGKFTTDIGYPWISMGAIIALEQYIRADHRVLETGAGGSTIFFAKRAASVRSYEREQSWYEKTLAALEKHGVKEKVSFVVSEDRNVLWQHMLDEPEDYYDIVLADLGNYFLRRALLEGSYTKLKKGGIIVMDNYLALHMRKNFDYSRFEVRTFDDWDLKCGTRILRKL